MNRDRHDRALGPLRGPLRWGPLAGEIPRAVPAPWWLIEGGGLGLKEPAVGRVRRELDITIRGILCHVARIDTLIRRKSASQSSIRLYVVFLPQIERQILATEFDSRPQ